MSQCNILSLNPPAMSSSPSAEAFEAAKKEFLRESDPGAGINLSSFTTIHDVYDTTDKIQQEQSNSKALRYLQRIQPYLTCINHYAAVIETFAQTKPEFISPIWVWMPCSICSAVLANEMKGEHQSHIVGM